TPGQRRTLAGRPPGAEQRLARRKLQSCRPARLRCGDHVRRSTRGAGAVGRLRGQRRARRSYARRLPALCRDPGGRRNAAARSRLVADRGCRRRRRSLAACLGQARHADRAACRRRRSARDAGAGRRARPARIPATSVGPVGAVAQPPPGGTAGDTPMTPPTSIATREVPQAAYDRLLAAGLSPELARLLAARGVAAADELDERLDGLLAPDAMKGIGRAAVLLADAIAAREALCVVADYDCDGATASAVAVR